MPHRRADVRSAPGLCVHQVLRLFLCGTHTMPAQYYLLQQYTLHIPSPYIHTHSRLCLYIHTQSIHIHTQAHTNLYIHIRMGIPAYNIHSFIYRQYTTILAYTYTHRAAAYLTHTSAQPHTLAHTQSMLYTYTETHTHTQRLTIIVLYTQIYTRGTNTIDTLCRGCGQCRQYAQCSLPCSYVPTTAAKTYKKSLTNTHSCVILNT